MISSKGAQFPKEGILLAAFFYVRCTVSYRDLEEILAERGKTPDFMLSKRRNKLAATKFFARTLEADGPPRKILIDRSEANTAGIAAIYRMLRSFGCLIPIEMVRIK